LQAQAEALSGALKRAYYYSKRDADAHRNATRNHTMILQMMVNSGSSKLQAINKIQAQIKKASKDAFLFNLKTKKGLWEKVGTSSTAVTNLKFGKCYMF